MIINDSIVSTTCTGLSRSTWLLRCGLFWSSFVMGESFAAVPVTGSSTSPSTSALLSSSSSSSCAVVGTGVLGTSLCRQILQDPNLAHWSVTGVTKTTNRHEAIRQQVLSSLEQQDDRFQLDIYDKVIKETAPRFQSVVFCAPPSGFEDYAAAVQEVAEKLWMGPEAGGVFLMTSSGGIYGQSTGVVSETTPIENPTGTPRVARLWNAEQACLTAGGSCLRLAGLYTLERGAHNFWFTSEKPITGPPNGRIALLHYDDAAGACLAALQAGPSVATRQIFLISDDHPLTRWEICTATQQAADYRDMPFPQFADGTTAETVDLTAEPVGKIYDGSWSNEQLQWKPCYESFSSFMASKA